MNAWSLALNNLSTIEPDTRHKCAWCGDMFEPYQTSRTIYCCNDCKEKGSKERKRKQAAERRRGSYKPIDDCKPAQKRNRERSAYWAWVFGTKDTKGEQNAST